MKTDLIVTPINPVPVPVQVINLLCLHCYISYISSRMAKRYHKRRIYDAMDTQYLEMGMTSVVIACYKDSEGKPVVNWYVSILFN